MSTHTIARSVFAEDVVLAVFHLLGLDHRIHCSNGVDGLFNETALNNGGIFWQFRWHRYYHFSQALHDSFILLLAVGAIRGETLSPYLYSTPHTCGPYGKTVLEKFSSQEQAVLYELKERLLQLTI